VAPLRRHGERERKGRPVREETEDEDNSFFSSWEGEGSRKR